MFKQLPISPNYFFDLNGNCKVDGILNNTNMDFFNIQINNRVYNFSKEWLKLVAHYEIELEINDLLKIDFVPCKSKVINLKCGFLTIIKKQIHFKNDFFIIPGFTRFAINKDSTVISINSGKILKSKINSYGYPYVNVYDPDKGRWRSVSTHILLARTFVHNKDPSSLFFVNHINGNKLDLRIKNLEWVTSVRNNNHAVETSLRSDNKPCKIRDIETLKISHFNSVSNCLRTLGFSNLNTKVLKNLNGKIIPHLLLNRFEIKYLDDISDWFFTKDNRNVNRYLNTGPYEALCTNTDKHFECKTIQMLSEKLLISEDRILTALKQLNPKTYNGFLIRKKSSEPWPTEYEETIFYKPRKLFLKNKITGEEVYFNSLRKAIMFLGIDKRTFKLRLKKNQPYENWEIIEI